MHEGFCPRFGLRADLNMKIIKFDLQNTHLLKMSVFFVNSWLET